MGMKVEGADQLIRKFEAAPRRIEDSLKRAENYIGADLLGKSAERAPFKEGDLRRAGYFDVRDGPGGPELEVGFEGLPYILPIHEGGWENFMGQYGPKHIENYTTPGTGPKFLENPWTENLPKYKEKIRDAVRKGLHG